MGTATKNTIASKDGSKAIAFLKRFESKAREQSRRRSSIFKSLDAKDQRARIQAEKKAHLTEICNGILQQLFDAPLEERLPLIIDRLLFIKHSDDFTKHDYKEIKR